jgi:site-specific recombinase XerD
LRLSCVSGKSKYHGTYRTLEAAKAEKKELVELIDTGKVLKIRKKDAAMMTFAEASKAIRESWQRRFANYELRKETADGYLVHAKLLDAESAKHRLRIITHDEIVAFCGRVAQQHSNVLANRPLFVLKLVFKHGLLLNAIFEDPAASIGKLSEKEHERNRFLYQPELEPLIASSHKTRAKYYMPALIDLGAEHGASRQEALDPKWEDAAFDYGRQGFIYLNGGGLKEAREMISHEDIAMTDRYTHLPMPFQQRIVNRLSEYYAGSGNVVVGTDAIEDSNKVPSQRPTLGPQSAETKKISGLAVLPTRLNYLLILVGARGFEPPTP